MLPKLFPKCLIKKITDYIKLIKNNSSNEQMKDDNNYAIISEIMMSISSRRQLHLDFVSMANINNMLKGAFSCANLKNLLNYMKTVALIQQHLFWKRYKESYNDMYEILTGILLYKLFMHCNS